MVSNAQIINASCCRRRLELEQTRNFLRGNGYVVCHEDWNVDPSADVILVSTCGFTKAAEDFGFRTLRRVQETKKPEAKVILGGCIPPINPERVSREFDGATFNPRSYSNLNEILDAKHKFEEFERPNTLARPSMRLFHRDMQSAIGIFRAFFDGRLSGLKYIFQCLSAGIRQRLDERKTFFIQIQEGCPMQCSYCVIRKAVGHLRSKPIATIIDQFQAGLDDGFGRFQLMGDSAGSYGVDIGTNLGDLLDRILAIEGDFDLDLTDINAVCLPPIFESVKRACAQNRLGRLYIPIQSANRRVLKLMNRDCDMDTVKRLLIQIKKSAPPGFKLGTSIIVGFPSETIDELNETIKFCSEVGFDWVWCHSFSARPETPAAVLPDRMPAEEILGRARLVKSKLNGKSLVTTAENTAGSRSCQGDLPPDKSNSSTDKRA